MIMAKKHCKDYVKIMLGGCDMAKEDISEQLEFLRNKGYTVYSISRLNSYNDCQYGYYRSYILRDRGENNVYASLGGKIHDSLEDVCNGIKTVEEMAIKFDDDFDVDTMFMNFPSEKIKDSWYADMKHFVSSFKPLQYDKIITEKGFVTNIDGVWMQGFIDVLAYNEDEVIILDWKTSSSFSKDKLLHAGRQLVLYKLAVEQMLNKKVDKLAWFMLKYVNVCYDGKIKQCNRSKWVDGISGLIKTQLKKLGYNNYEDMIVIATENNNLNNMPQEVRDRFNIEPSIIWYDVTDELIQETINYITDTISEIEGKDVENVRAWECKNIYKDKGFFCKNLCSHSKNCKMFKWYLENNK